MKNNCMMMMLDEIVGDGKKAMLTEASTKYAGKAPALATQGKSKHSEVVN